MSRHLILAAVVGASVHFSASCGSEGKTLSRSGFQFERPAGLKAEHGTVAASSGEPLTSDAFGLDANNLIIVRTYALRVSIDEGNVGRLRPEIQRIFQGLLQVVHGVIATPLRRTKANPLPGFELTAMTDSVSGARVRERIILLFHGSRELFVLCQWRPAQRARMSAACRKLAVSVRTS
jgi:hypothetical protein